MTVKRSRIVIDKVFHGIFMISALVSIISVILILFFIAQKGIKPFIPGNIFGNYNFLKFIVGQEWHPSEAIYGVGFMIISSILATIGAILIGVPIAILTAIFIAEVAPKRIANLVRPAIELLAAIPSVLYGVIGFALVTPLISKISPNTYGDSLIAVIVVLSIMILPTIIAVAETSLRAVPKSYKEGSLALGATKMQTIFKVMLPAAKSGILTGVILGVGRAIGETMAVILIAGNPESGIPTSIFDKVRLLTTNIVLEMGYAAEMHEQMLFATAIVLFFFIILINGTLQYIQKKTGDH